MIVGGISYEILSSCEHMRSLLLTNQANIKSSKCILIWMIHSNDSLFHGEYLLEFRLRWRLGYRNDSNWSTCDHTCRLSRVTCQDSCWCSWNNQNMNKILWREAFRNGLPMNFCNHCINPHEIADCKTILHLLYKKWNGIIENANLWRIVRFKESLNFRNIYWNKCPSPH